MPKTIKSISFLFEGRRVTIESDPKGTFRLPFEKRDSHRGYSSPSGVYYRSLTARQVIDDSRVKNADPVLTLYNGEKVRIFVSGDSSYLPAASEGILTKHDGPPDKKFSAEKADTLDDFKLDWGIGTDDDWF